MSLAATTSIARVFEPLPEHRGIYDELYHGVFRKMYVRLKSLHLEFQKITGYPRFD